MKRICLHLFLILIFINNVVCFSESTKDSNEINGTTISIGQTVTGTLTSTDPVEDGYFFDTYFITTSAGVNYRIEMTTNSGKTIWLSTDTDDGEYDILSTNSNNYTDAISDGGTLTIYISAYEDDISSGNIGYSFRITVAK